VKRLPLTLKGAEKLRAELKRLKSEDRPRVIQAIAEARAHGDLSENAEYHAAREQQSFIEGRIKDIEAHLSNSEIIDVASMPATDKVVFGATVELEDEDTGTKVLYQIVGDAEADIKQRPDLGVLADRARTGRQVRRRHRRCRRAERHALVRDRGGALRIR